MKSFNEHPSSLRAGAALLAGTSVLAACSGSRTTESNPVYPTGAYVVQEAGRAVLDMCFKTPDGKLVVLNMNPDFGFYAGNEHLYINPQLNPIRATGNNLSASSKVGPYIGAKNLVTQIKDRKLQPYTKPYHMGGMVVQCEKTFAVKLQPEYDKNLVSFSDWTDGGSPTEITVPADGRYSNDPAQDYWAPQAAVLANS